jgi:hypothetical protein|tara:strand:- start:8439 stop:8798 length:360 start_codon:yes stop_codon:yes gene_type:complete
MIKKNLSVRVSQEVHAYLSEHYPNVHAGAKEVMESFPSLRDETIKEMNGTFTDEEIGVLRQIEQEIPVSDNRGSRRMWEARIADAFDANSYDVDFTELISKIRGITPFERFILRQNLYY